MAVSPFYDLSRACGHNRLTTIAEDSTGCLSVRPPLWNDLAVPRKASKCQLLITAREKGGNGVLTLPLLTADAFQLGLYSFREYGPQRVTVTLPVADGQPSRVVEML